MEEPKEDNRDIAISFKEDGKKKGKYLIYTTWLFLRIGITEVSNFFPLLIFQFKKKNT